ncbi:hypothetical protein Cadr_000000370 [Camelus dromedarius]|uniref:Uncharacterized protein n=1 Tax=Camelus dromedarius TaxID=9838 RepID=A0A5N4EHY3_CAMDR|nr:hypothetical protein Cadr_000000370 [Camelus dromedarius]
MDAFSVPYSRLCKTERLSLDILSVLPRQYRSVSWCSQAHGDTKYIPYNTEMEEPLRLSCASFEKNGISFLHPLVHPSLHDSFQKPFTQNLLYVESQIGPRVYPQGVYSLVGATTCLVHLACQFQRLAVYGAVWGGKLKLRVDTEETSGIVNYR